MIHLNDKHVVKINEKINHSIIFVMCGLNGSPAKPQTSVIQLISRSLYLQLLHKRKSLILECIIRIRKFSSFKIRYPRLRFSRRWFWSSKLLFSFIHSKLLSQNKIFFLYFPSCYLFFVTYSRTLLWQVLKRGSKSCNAKRVDRERNKRQTITLGANQDMPLYFVEKFRLGREKREEWFV